MELTELKKELKYRIQEKIGFMKDYSDTEVEDAIDEAMLEQRALTICPPDMRRRLKKELFDSLRRLDILQIFVEDSSVTEIMINGKDHIFVEQGGSLRELDVGFESAEKLLDVIQQIVAGCNRVVNEASPIVDARLPDGSRVNVVMSPVALNGPIVTIRRFPDKPITMEGLIRTNSVSSEAAEFLAKLVRAKYNVFISGGTGSGKTTMLNALSQYIPKDERIITIEDNAELQILDVPNLVRLEARNANVEGVGEITIRDLIRSALRMRPNRVIVGEVRGPETIDMLQAMSTGHKGSLSTGHSDSPKDMLRRLETMVLMGMDIPLAAIQRQIASAIDIIIHIGRLWDKSRKVLEVVEVLDYNGEEIDTKTLYRFEVTGRRGEQVIGEWKKVQDITNTSKLFSAGYTSL